MRRRIPPVDGPPVHPTSLGVRSRSKVLARPSSVESFSGDLDHVAIGIEQVDLRKSRLGDRVEAEPAQFIRVVHAITLRLEVFDRPAIAADPDAEVDIARVDPLPYAEGGAVADDQVKLAIAELVPGPRKVEGRAGDLLQLEDVAIESLGPLEVRDRDAHMVDGLDAQHA